LLTSTPIYAALSEASPNNISCAQPLSKISYWKIGGNVDYFVEPQTIEQLANVRKVLNQYPDIPNMIIGDCSNLLFDDEGFHGVIVKIGNNLNQVTFDNEHVFCGAGVWVPGLAYQSYRKGLSGLEHTCGIPGRLGGLIYMNGGSNRQSISENLESVVLIGADGTIETINTDDLGFSYRASPFQDNKRIIAGATLKLNASNVATVRSSMRKVLSSRRKKFPRKLPNCGSVFVSDPKMYEIVGPPGFAIEKVGLKGTVKGNAQISNLHANFIVNLGGASSHDVLYLIALARSTVHKATNFWMDCEARYISPTGEIRKAHEKADELFSC
jgi:UDP-N-acetylmuramate dehydrogenase